jgi:hypothetical protein
MVPNEPAIEVEIEPPPVRYRQPASAALDPPAPAVFDSPAPVQPAAPFMQQTVVFHSHSHSHSHKDFPHMIHLFLTIATCGFWLPIWICAYMLSR